jgi:hypothetical protein
VRPSDEWDTVYVVAASLKRLSERLETLGPGWVKETGDRLAEEQRMGFEPYLTEEDFLDKPFGSAQCFTQPTSIGATGPSTQPNLNISAELANLSTEALKLRTLANLLVDQIATLALRIYSDGKKG